MHTQQVTGARQRTRKTTTSDQSRKQRNCVAQKAYRQRQTLHLRELEQKLESLSKSEHDRCTELEESNAYYRDQLLDAYKKLESTRITLQGVLDSVGKALGMQSKKTIGHAKQEQNFPNNRSESEVEEYSWGGQMNQHPVVQMEGHIVELPLGASEQHIASIYLSPSASDETTNDPFTQIEPLQVLPANNISAVDENIVIKSIPPIAPTNDHSSIVPRAEMDYYNHTSVDFDLPFDVHSMGSEGFDNIITNGPVLFDDNGFQFRMTNSPFSDHLRLVERLVGQRWGNPVGGTNKDHRKLQNAVSFMISTFTCLSWEPMISFLAYTKSHKSVVNVTSSHVNPGWEACQQVDSWYRPTHIQSTVPHPAVIDWVPFPFLRDRLIIHHSSNPRLDEIICDIADAYACDIDLSELVMDVNPVLAIIRVSDLLDAITSTRNPRRANNIHGISTSCLPPFSSAMPPNISNLDYFEMSMPSEPARTPDSTKCLPASSLTELFSCKNLALQAFSLLGMDRGPGYLKLDSAFFKKHPELYDRKADPSIARGIPVKSPFGRNMKSTPTPNPLDTKTLAKYTEMAKWALEV